MAETSSSNNSNKNRSFIWLSDIHLDPYYGTPQAFIHNSKLGTMENCTSTNHVYGDIGCDSPPILLEAVFDQASRLSNVDFVIVTGDFVRHGTDELPIPQNTTEAILYNTSRYLRDYFVTKTTSSSNNNNNNNNAIIRVVPSLGNNDVTPDYYLDADHPQDMLAMVTRGLSPLLSQEEQVQFQQGGYYAVNVTAQITVLSLNTVMYSTNHIPPTALTNLDDADNDQDPLGQFAWLERQLQWARTSNRHVYIMGHIPPTVGSFRHTQLWHEAYLERYYHIVHQFSSQVKAQLFGHIHTDEFRVHHHNDMDSALILTSSVTPIYGSNPSFRVVTYDQETSDLLDYHVQYIDLDDTNNQNQNTATSSGSISSSSSSGSFPVWKQGEPFTQVYGVPDMSVASLLKIVQELQTTAANSVYWEALLVRLHVYTHDASVCNAGCRLEWACTLSSMTRHQYDACLVEEWWTMERQDHPAALVLLLIGVTAMALTCVAMACQYVKQHFYRRHYEIPACHHHHHDNVDVDGTGTGGEQQLPELA